MEKMLDTVQSYAEMGKYKRVPVFRELYADAFTPVEVMRSLRAASRHCFLLESAEDKQKWGRYSFLGYAPTLEITCTDGRVTITEGGEDENKRVRQFQTDHPGKVLRNQVESFSLLDRDARRRRESAFPWSGNLKEKSRSSGYAWAIRPLGRLSALPSSMPPG